MILHGHKKKVLKEVIRYFVETTGSKYDDFILNLNRVKGKQESEYSYSEWLAVHSYGLLKQHEITIQDCIENKDIINATINEDASRNAGEFYTPEVWCKDGREYIKNMVGDKWGEAYIWEASAGSGNLLRTIDYPKDKIFMSTLLPEDVEIIQATPEFEGVEAFQLDFLNGIDWDDRNMHFSEKLPPRLLEVLKNNEPLVFYMNPPYKVMEATSSDVGAYMASQGMAKCALDLFHQFMYRIVMLKRTYNLTNVYVGVFGPVTMYHSKMIEPLYNEFKEEFQFQDGMCFDAGDFSNTSESIGWMIGYTAWRSKQEGDKDKSILLDAKMIEGEDTVKTVGKRVVKGVDINIHEWVKAKDIIRKDTMLPIMTNFFNFADRTVKSPSNYLGYVMSSNYAIRATRRACVTTLPNPDNVPITEENFWRAVASFASRRCYAIKQDSFNNSQYLSKPDVSLEGYDQWVIDALVIFLFDYSAHQSAYRKVDNGGTEMNFANRLFPISKDHLRGVITDPKILQDLEENPAENEFLLSILSQVQDKFSPDAKELYEFCLQAILTSLHGNRRADFDYGFWTDAWDAGFNQIREVKGLLPKEDLDKYSYLLSKLKSKLYDGIYKFGFMMDSAFYNEDSNNLDEEYDEEETG